MNIVYENFLKDAVISSTDVNNNFPLSNLYHRFLKLPYQSLYDPAVTITVEFDEVKDIDAIFVGYHNLSSIQIKMYDVSVSEIYDSGVLVVTENIDVVHYTSSTISDVKKVEVILLTTVQAYFEVGNITVGKKISFPYIETPDIENKLGGDFDKSITGQITGEYETNLKEKSIGLLNLIKSDIDSINRMMLYNGNFIPMWIDLYPTDTNLNYPPLFGNLTRSGRYRKHQGKFMYDTSLDFEECK